MIYMSGGVMRVQKALRRGQRYDVWSYAPRPSPAGLVRSTPARYPAAARRYLDLGRAISPPFGAPGRAAEVDALFTDQLYVPLWPYRGLWHEAQRLTRGARSPYEATVAIEGWLRDNGGFTYDEHPPRPAGLPPLADFVERSKLGYCQQFAGSMALMLRMLGIPARVAVGFTSGDVEPRHLDRHRPRCTCLGGGLVRRLRLACVRSNPWPRHALGLVHARRPIRPTPGRALGAGRFLDFSGDGQSERPPQARQLRPRPWPAASRGGCSPARASPRPTRRARRVKAARRRRAYAPVTPA